MQTRYDLVVIGSGPGGEGAAMRATKEGKSVLVIDRQAEVGGSCTHWSTIPSKALRYAVRQVMDLTHAPLFHELLKPARLTFAQLLQSASSVISKQVNLRQGFYERNGVRLVQGRASFIDPHIIDVEEDKSAHERFEGDAFVIAAGSRPYRPPDVDFHHPRIFDSETILRLEDTPQSITIYGAGVVGCEYASIFRTLGVKLNLVNTRKKLLEFLDDEIIDALSYHLREQGALIRHNEEYERVEGEDDGVVLHLKSGKKLKTDILLWANGRTGNSDGLGLDRLGIIPDSRGNIPVNHDYQTALPHIYAVGDIIGFPALASAAYDQGRFAVSHLLTGTCEHLIDLIPTGIYTTPEISSVGRSERELTERSVPYEVGHAFFKSLARAQITGQTVGMLKILFHRETLQILGLHCFGDQASEIIHIGQAIMSQKGEANTIRYFVNTTFNYPTMAEAYRVAALNGLNRLF
ncbi:MAG: Si-specific NAD(P)(+) transhydrogenase [Deltaproteobacteria bacterium]|nr:Si-specific NAD(P)(+) transhydrogenase [Deltaproteobacteria bacterium]MBI3388091.1 Si-specific NAD(P)(+) transhydrogenase [Deltaproteobacteria bacterium]